METNDRDSISRFSKASKTTLTGQLHLTGQIKVDDESNEIEAIPALILWRFVTESQSPDFDSAPGL